MRAVTASFIGFCFMIPSAWAVEVAAPATQPAATPVQAVTSQAPAQGASAQQTGIIPAVATTAQTVQPTEKKPLTAEEIAKLTDPFYQVESSSSRSYQGTGLGLAIAKKIVELMGGELTITSELGKGAVFAFSVIVKKAPLIISENPSSELTQRTNWNGMAAEYPAKILLAEDNELNLQLMRLILEQLGYDFDEAKNGQVALDLVIKKEFDIILMDVQMPVLNGLEAAKQIRLLGEKGELFIIGLSANVFDEDQKKAIEAGMDDYLTKPIRLVALAEKIMEYSLKRDSKKAE